VKQDGDLSLEFVRLRWNRNRDRLMSLCARVGALVWASALRGFWGPLETAKHGVAVCGAGCEAESDISISFLSSSPHLGKIILFRSFRKVLASRLTISDGYAELLLPQTTLNGRGSEGNPRAGMPLCLQCSGTQCACA
jgi:hypothetical protein